MAEVNAQVTGTVWKVEVAVGDRVREGDELVILESMKMEIPVEAEHAGTVTRIFVAEGDNIGEGDPVVDVQRG